MLDRHTTTYDWAGRLVRERITRRLPPTITILDAGAGWGKYRTLLPEYPNMHACEVDKQTVETERLRERYSRVHRRDLHQLLTAAETPRYDVVIFGEVLEHLPRPEAQAVVGILAQQQVDMYAVVSFQAHSATQPDLNPGVMLLEYPWLRPDRLEYRGRRPIRGLYVNR